MPEWMKNALLAVFAVMVLTGAAVAVKDSGGSKVAAGQDALSVPPTTTSAVGVFVGDSYVAGAPKSSDVHGFAYLTDARLRLDPEVLGEPGDGYATSGIDGRTIRSDALRVSPRARLVVFSGGFNDVNSTATPQQVETAASAAFASARQAAPSAIIVVLEPLWPNAQVPVKLGEVRAAVQSAASAQRVTFLPTDGFMTDVPLLSDGVHPTREGHALLSERVSAALSPLLKG